MFKYFLLAMILCLTTTFATAGTINLGLNDDSVNFGYEHTLTQDNYGSTLINGLLLYNDDTTLGNIGIDFVGNPGNISGLNLGIGTKLYVGNTDPDFDFINLAIGIRGDYTFPQLQGLGIGAHLYCAPDILSWQDSKRLWDTEVRVSYAVVPRAKVYIAYQYIRLTLDDTNKDRDIDDSLRIGFSASF